MQSVRYSSPVFIACFDGAEPPADPPADAAATAAAAAAAAAANAAAANADHRSFNQDQLNKLLAEEKRKGEAKLKAVLTEKQTLVDKLLTDKTLSDQERTALQAEKEELAKQLLTKEERLKAEKKAVEDALNAKVKDIEAKATEWETRYAQSSIQRELQEAAVKNDAFNPSQLVTLLKPMTTFEAVNGADGKPTGEYKTVVTMDGKTYTPAEAIAAMKAVPAQYGNLFKAAGVPGVGGSSAPAGAPGGTGVVDWGNLSQAQYEEMRGKNPALPAGKRR